jgi:phosphohistidine phosphatase SixA
MKFFFNSLYLYLVLLFISQPAFGQLIYVKHDAVGSNTGSNWGDAYTSLNDALNASGSGDTIFVAAGTYYPDQGSGLTSGDRNTSFQLKSGVVLMGGYAGNEELSPLSTRWKKYGRDWQINKTILSGDLLQNDNGTASSADPLRSDNSIHVVNVSGISDSTTEINGFIIESGNANSDLVENGLSGAGLWAADSRLNIKNCLFRNNSSSGNGGAACLYRCEVLIANSSFIQNNGYSGGAVYFENNNGQAVAKQKVYNSFFYNNAGINNGGAISLNTASDAELINIIITGNQVTADGSTGGGLYADGESYPGMINSTVYNNTAVTSGAGICISAGKIKNSIVRGNISNDNQQIFISGEPADPSAARDFTNSSVEGGFAGDRIYDLEPGFISPGNPMGDDGIFGTADDGLMISDVSPVKDSGDVSVNNSFADAQGMPRYSLAAVDLGAYESQRYIADLSHLLSELQTGGYTVLFNHTMTNPAEIDSPGYQVDLHWCWMQKNLTSEGMEQARFLGGAIQFLGINFDVILCSPMCRTKESTRQMFGQDSTEHDIFKSSFVWLQDDTDFFADRRTRLGTILGAGHNTVIVTHADLIAEMTGMNKDEIKEGDAVVFRPLGSGNYEIVAHLTTDSWSQMFKYNIETTSIGEDAAANHVRGFILYDNYPNPFNPSTNLKYYIAAAGLVTLKIFDILGREVRTLVNETRTPGEYNVEFNANGLGSGVYFASLRMDEKQVTKKIVLLK